MTVRRKFAIIFIAVNVGVLVWTPFYAGRMPLRLEIAVGVISAIGMNGFVYFLMRKSLQRQGSEK
jgi:hypothetical protein